MYVSCTLQNPPWNVTWGMSCPKKYIPLIFFYLVTLDWEKICVRFSISHINCFISAFDCQSFSGRTIRKACTGCWTESGASAEHLSQGSVFPACSDSWAYRHHASCPAERAWTCTKLLCPRFTPPLARSSLVSHWLWHSSSTSHSPRFESLPPWGIALFFFTWGVTWMIWYLLSRK